MKLLVAGGGTGGHLFPGIAIAEELVGRGKGKDNSVIFVGTERGIEKTEVPRMGYEVRFIDVTGIKGKGFAGAIRGLLRLPRALIQSLRLLRLYRPDVVVGVGGYASGPVLLAAWLSGIPIALQEPNAVPGFTNRVLGTIAAAAFTAFPEAGRHFPRHKVFLLGNPIRKSLRDNNFLTPAPPVEGRFSVLVFGGSQGAHALNERMIEAVPLLPPALRKVIHVVHQTGTRDLAAARAAYARVDADVTVREFIEEMSPAYQQADLVVSRAGATTIAELTCCHKPAILIPLPTAADDHQTKNAAALVATGAAVAIPQAELTGARLAAEITRLWQDPAGRAAMARAAGTRFRPQAAYEIVDVLVQLAARRVSAAGARRARRGV